MKNQYFGDINDYRKYGIIRILSGSGDIRTAVCWMLTEKDDRSDGDLIDYLDKPDVWRAHDPQLFDLLAHFMKTPGRRSVQLAEESRIIPSALYYTVILKDNADERKQYFRNYFSVAKGSDLIFFDPDNGLEVKSVKCGKSLSSKYLYWNELKEAFGAGHSVLVYQHFPRVKHDVFIEMLTSKAARVLGLREVISFQTRNVFFLLMPQKRHAGYFRARSREVTHTWSQDVSVNFHLLS